MLLNYFFALLASVTQRKKPVKSCFHLKTAWNSCNLDLAKTVEYSNKREFSYLSVSVFSKFSVNVSTNVVLVTVAIATASYNRVSDYMLTCQTKCAQAKRGFKMPPVGRISAFWQYQVFR